VQSLEVNVAKILQSLPEQKRDGNTIMTGISNSLTFETSKSVSNAGAIITQMEFIPELAKRLQENPDEVIKEIKEFREHGMFVAHFEPSKSDLALLQSPTRVALDLPSLEMFLRWSNLALYGRKTLSKPRYISS
jgi:hypothetical protein